MTEAELRINKRVVIKVSQKGAYSGCYPSRVEDISPNRIVLAAPLKGQKTVPLEDGEVITVEYCGSSAVYSFTTRIVGTGKGHLPTITVESPQMIRRRQRRSFLRMKARIPVTLTPVSAGGNLSPPPIYQMETVDISGGGLMLKSPLPFPEGESLELEVSLPQRGVVEALGKVVRVEMKKGGSSPCYMLGIEFTVIKEAERQKIISYVYELQRRMHKRRIY